ncbi:MAG: helix-turn-helix domain-containing protein, partial [Myxococcota bacterium]
RWTMLIVRDLMLGPLRFGELLAIEEGIGPNLLASRLRRLEDAGVVTQSRYGRARSYALTEHGQSLKPILLGLGAFGSSLPGSLAEKRGCFDWFAFSLHRRGRASRRADPVLLRCGSRQVVVSTAPELLVQRGDGVGISERVEGELPALAAWLARGKDWKELEASGALKVDGDRRAIERFSRLFTLP